MLDEFCRVAGYKRKYALRLLNGPPREAAPAPRRPPGSELGGAFIAEVWRTADALGMRTTRGSDCHTAADFEKVYGER